MRDTYEALLVAAAQGTACEHFAAPSVCQHLVAQLPCMAQRRRPFLCISTMTQALCWTQAWLHPAGVAMLAQPQERALNMYLANMSYAGSRTACHCT